MKVLKLGRLFNQKIEKDVLPNNLKKLYLSDNYNYELQKGDLPDELEILHIGRYYNKNINFDNLPSKLKRLVFLNNNYMGKIIIGKHNKELKDLIITNSIFENGDNDIKNNIHHFEFINIINSEFFYLNNKRYIKEYKTDDLIFIKYYIQNIFRTKYKKRKYEDELKLKIIEPKNIKKYLDYGYELDDVFEVLNLISE